MKIELFLMKIEHSLWRNKMSKRALISVFEKDNIIEFAEELVKLGWEIISTGGTYKILKESGLSVLEVDEVTNFKEILNGRVKTLHPYIHGGILYRRNDNNHVETVKNLGISSIDMVVNNLYPFEKVLNSENNTHENLIENIDIGGPSMIRAAAKNYNDVSIVVDPKDYPEIIERLKNNKLDKDFRLYLSCKAFNYTAYYDALISSYFNDLLNIDFPEKLTTTYKKVEDLRYGENPHQKASFYEKVYIKDEEKTDFKQLHGKELSYNNLTDMYSAIKIVKEFDEPCVVAVKHNNPCGLAIGENIDEAYDKAYACDSISIFGGILLAFPYIIWELWRFISPALLPNERKYSLIIIHGTWILFFFGALCGYFIILPFAINFGYFFRISDEIKLSYDLSDYLSIFLQVVFGMAIIFLFPMIVYVLTSLGILTPRLMKTYRRHAIVIIMIIAAIITPADVVSMFIAAIPLLLLYEMSIAMAQIIHKRLLKEQDLD